MGEASRRQKLDPNYGKVPSLATPSQKYKHSEIIFQELIEQFQVEFTHLFNAKTVPENYQTVTEQVRLWFKDKLLTYREPDRVYLAKYVFFMLVEMEEHVSFSPLAISCIFKAVKDYFSPSEIQGLLNRFEGELPTAQYFTTDPCEQFAYEEMVKEARLSLAVDSNP